MGRILKLLGILILAGALAGGLYAVVQARNHKENGVKLVPVTRGAITEKALAVGQIQPRARFQVKSKISGIVRTCHIEVGDTVQAGDPLFEIAPDPTPQELLAADHGLRSASASFEKAQADYRRSQALHEQGLISTRELNGTREAFELAQVALEQARDTRELVRRGKVTGSGTQVEDLIRSPPDGTVLSRAVDPGDPVVPLTSYQPGTEMASIADMSDLIFEGTVDEIDVGKIGAGLACRIKVGALPDAVVAGRVARISPQARQSEGATLFEVEIEIDASPETVLRAGYSANADVVIREKSDVLILPERLVIFEDGGAKTFVELPGEERDAAPRKVEVQLGLSDGLNVEITGGLAEGDQVVQRPPKEIA